jgi:hypothetical protein
MALSETVVRAAVAARPDEHRLTLARHVLALARRALPPGSPLELVLTQEAALDRSTAARVVISPALRFHEDLRR